MLKLKLQYFGHLIWTDDSLEKSLLLGKRRASEDEMAGRHHWCSEHELGQILGDGEGQGSLACCSPWGCKKLDLTGQLNTIHISPPSWTFPPLPTPLGCHRALSWVPLVHNKFPIAVLHRIIQMFLCCSLNPSHPLLPPLCLQVCSLCLCLYCCPADRFICTIFLDSTHTHRYIYICQYTIFVFLTYCTLCTVSRLIHLS